MTTTGLAGDLSAASSASASLSDAASAGFYERKKREPTNRKYTGDREATRCGK